MLRTVATGGDWMDAVAGILDELRSAASEPDPPKWTNGLIESLEALQAGRVTDAAQRNRLADGIGFLVTDDLPLADSDLGYRLLQLTNRLRRE